MFLKKFWKKKNYLLQLFFTIAGFVCIPLIISQVLMMEKSAEGYAKLNEESVYENLQSCIRDFSEQLNDMSYTSIKISQDASVRRAAKKEIFEYSIYEAAKRIGEYSDEVCSVGVWFYENNFVLYNEVKITPDQLYDRLAGGSGVGRKAIEELFEKRDVMRVISMAEYSDGGDVIVVVKPVSFLSVMEKDASVFFVLKQEVQERNFAERFHECSGVALLNEAGEFLIRSEEFTDELRECEEFQSFLRGEGEIIYKIRDGKERLNIYRYRNGADGYTCLVSLFGDNMEAHLRQYIDNIRDILMVSIMLMLLSLSITVSINYKPIKRLAIKHGELTDSRGLSELERLESAFFSNDQKVLNQKKLLTNFMIGDLLTGRPVEEKLLEESFPEKGSYVSMVIALSGPAINSIQAGRVTAAISERFDGDAYITSVTYRPQILLVCILPSEVQAEDLKDSLSQVLKEITGHSYGINCGTVVADVLEIRTSYLKSLTGLNENSHEIQELDKGVAKAIQAFGEGLYTGDTADMQRLLDVVESKLESLKGAEELKKYYCYKLLTVYFANAKTSQDMKEEMGRLITFNDVQQLCLMLRQTIKRMCAKASAKEQATVNKLQKKLLMYVDVNFNNQNLCLTSAADYMETSIYAVSRLFKEATGKGFKEYITDKRLEHARGLLETTDYNITEIAAMSGFENTVYFSSVFKTKYEMPPTQYRKKWQEQ